MSGKDGNNPVSLENINNPAALTLAPSGTPVYETTYNNFAPRLGVAYVLREAAGRETVLRGGGGIFYDLGSGSLDGEATDFPFRRPSILFGGPEPPTASQA